MDGHFRWSLPELWLIGGAQFNMGVIYSGCLLLWWRECDGVERSGKLTLSQCRSPPSGVNTMFSSNFLTTSFLFTGSSLMIYFRLVQIHKHPNYRCQPWENRFGFATFDRLGVTSSGTGLVQGHQSPAKQHIHGKHVVHQLLGRWSLKLCQELRSVMCL